MEMLLPQVPHSFAFAAARCRSPRAEPRRASLAAKQITGGCGGWLAKEASASIMFFFFLFFS